MCVISSRLKTCLCLPKMMIGLSLIIAITGNIWCLSDGAILNTTIPATINREAILPCRLPSNAYEGVNVRWYSKKDGWLTSGKNVYQHFSQIAVMKPAPNEWNLLIRKVAYSFEDTYTCKTDHDEVISMINLIIETPPKIDEYKSTPKRVSFKEGENADLRCVVTGTPTPEIHWYRGTSGKPTPIGVSGGELKIPNIKRYAIDEYVCRANSTKGVAELRIQLTVNFPAEATVMESTVYAAGGEVAVMSCVVQGSPNIKGHWLDLDGKQITPNWKYLVMQEDAGDGIPVKFSQLIIRKNLISKKYYGHYTCVATGDNSEARAVVELKDRAEQPTEEDGKVINYN